MNREKMLRFSNIGFAGKNATNYIMTVLCEVKNVVAIDLRLDMCIGGEHGLSECILKITDTLKIVTLHSKWIGSISLKPVFDAVASCPHLRELTLSGESYNIDEAHCREIIDFLWVVGPRLRVLELFRFYCEAQQEMSSAIGGMVMLEELNIDTTNRRFSLPNYDRDYADRIRCNTTMAYIRGTAGHKRLTTLTVTSILYEQTKTNESITDVLCTVLPTIVRLETLNISNMVTTKEQTAAILSAVTYEGQQSVKTINFGITSISLGFVKDVIYKIMQHNYSITDIDIIRQEWYSDKKMSYINYVLKYNRDIRNNIWKANKDLVTAFYLDQGTILRRLNRDCFKRVLFYTGHRFRLSYTEYCVELIRNKNRIQIYNSESSTKRRRIDAK